MKKLLNDRFVAGAAQDTYFDTEARGLALRVGPRGKMWYFTYRNGAGTQWLKLGEFPALGLAAARDAAWAERKRLNDPTQADPKQAAVIAKQEQAAPVPPTPPAFTFAHFVPVFIGFQKGRKKTWYDDEAMIDRYLADPWNDIPLKQLERRHVVEILDTAVAGGLGVGVNRLQMLISRIFVVALDRGLISAHPSTRMIKRAKEQARERVLTDAELRTCIAGLDTVQTAASDALRLRLLLGQRGEETCGITWDEIDIDKSLWTMAGTRTKNGRPHVVLLPKAALAVIQRRRKAIPDADEPRVFPGLSLAHDDYRALSSINAGAYKWTDLRRTVSTRLADLGFDETTIGRVLNHARVTVTAKHYNQHEYLEEKRQALTAWDTELTRILANVPRSSRVVSIRRRRRR